MRPNLVETYGWATAEAPHSCEYIAPEIINILKRLYISRVLDVGSGNGKLCCEIKRSGLIVVGVENDVQGVETSKSNYPDIHFYNYGVQDDPGELLAQEGAFDAVVSTEVIEHLFSPHLLPIYARAVLKNKGYLVITTPYHGYLKNLAISIVNKWDFHHTALWHGGHIKFWSRSTLTRLFEENGFDVVGFSGVGRVRYLWKSMIMIGMKK